MEGSISDGKVIIRHYWEGKVECTNPVYGRWGGPPADLAGRSSSPQPARDLANAPRGKVKLTQVVESPLPELGLKGVKRKLRPGESSLKAP